MKKREKMKNIVKTYEKRFILEALSSSSINDINL